MVWKGPTSVPFKTYVKWWPARPCDIGLLPNDGLIVLASLNFPDHTIAISSHDGRNWKQEFPVIPKWVNWVKGAVVADGRLQALPLPDLTPVSFSPILQLPDRSFIVVASQSSSFCVCANTHIYVATEEDLRRVTTTSLGKMDQ